MKTSDLKYSSTPAASAHSLAGLKSALPRHRCSLVIFAPKLLCQRTVKSIRLAERLVQYLAAAQSSTFRAYRPTHPNPSGATLFEGQCPTRRGASLSDAFHASRLPSSKLSLRGYSKGIQLLDPEIDNDKDVQLCRQGRARFAHYQNTMDQVKRGFEAAHDTLQYDELGLSRRLAGCRILTFILKVKGDQEHEIEKEVGLHT